MTRTLASLTFEQPWEDVGRALLAGDSQCRLPGRRAGCRGGHCTGKRQGVLGQECRGGLQPAPVAVLRGVGFILTTAASRGRVEGFQQGSPGEAKSNLYCSELTYVGCCVNRRQSRVDSEISAGWPLLSLQDAGDLDSDRNSFPRSCDLRALGDSDLSVCTSAGPIVTEGLSRCVNHC